MVDDIVYKYQLSFRKNYDKEYILGNNKCWINIPEILPNNYIDNNILKENKFLTVENA